MGTVAEPIVINLPYGKHSFKDFAEAYAMTYGEADPESNAGGGMTYLEWETLDFIWKPALKYVIDYPTVYVVYFDGRNRHSQRIEYTAYIGETNDIIRRTAQHLDVDPRTREDWKAVADAVMRDPAAFRQYVVGHPLFNKSMTLDVENRLMHYMSSVESVKGSTIAGRTRRASITHRTGSTASFPTFGWNCTGRIRPCSRRRRLSGIPRCSRRPRSIGWARGSLMPRNPF